MGSSKTVPWIVGTVVVALLIVAGAWLLAISPRMASAAETQDQVTAAQARMDQLGIQLAGLERDFRNIDDLRAELDELQIEIPSEIHISDLTRELSDLAQQSRIFVLAVSPGVPVSVVPVAAAPAATVEPAAENTADVATEPTTPAAVTIDGFYAVPFEIVVLGPYPQTVDFITSLQTQSSRLLVVTGISSTAQEAAGAQSGRPAVVAGDIETSIKGYAYVLVDGSGAVPTEEEAADPEEMPAPAAPDNPFAPVT
jgi:hypothetical protein